MRKKAVIKIYAAPKSGKTTVAGRHGDAIKIRIAAPPVKGRANRELISFLAKKLGVAKSDVTIKAGESSRNKEIIIAGMDIQTVESKLLEEK